MLAVASTVVALCVPALFIAYKRIRPYFSVRVNCWFCGKDTVVPYGNINCWDCPSCEQYNGFREDGDYNKPIPSQYDESLNFAFTSGHNDSCGDALQFDSDNGLCPTCNYNQLVKIRLLANFTPLREEDYDEEAKAYGEHIECVYGMCRECELHVQRRLTEQDSFLWPQVRDFYVASGKMLQTYSSKERFSSFGAHVTNALSAAVATLLAVELLLEREIGPASPLAMQITGSVFCFGSVLLAGRSRFGPLELLSCWFWLVLHVFSGGWTFMEERQLHSLRAMVAVVIAALTLFRLGRGLLCSARKRKWTLRKLKSTMQDPSMKSVSREFVRNTDSKSTREGYKTAVSSEKVPPLHNLMDDCHISPEGKRAWSSGSRSNFGNESHVSCGAAEGSRPLLWPPRLSPPPSSKGSWMAGGTWAVGGSHSKGEPLITWGVKHTYGVLTPPPSAAGSSTSFRGASAAAEKTMFKDFQSFGNCPRQGNGWLNLRSPATPQNFYSATAVKPIFGNGLVDRPVAWSSHSLCNNRHEAKAPLLTRRSSCAGNLPAGRDYAASSVSQNPSVRQFGAPPASSAYSGAHVNGGGRFSCHHMFLLASIVTNVSLFAYFIVVPKILPIWP